MRYTTRGIFVSLCAWMTECFRFRWHLYETSSWFFHHLKDRTLQQSCNQFSNIPLQRQFLYTSKKFNYCLISELQQYFMLWKNYFYISFYILHSKVKPFLVPFSLSCAIKNDFNGLC